MRNKNARRPVWTDANHSSFLHELLEDVDPMLLTRKGTLHLLCSADIKEPAAAALYQNYYSDTSFDTLPSLHGALLRTCQDYKNVHRALWAAVVVRDMDIFALAADDVTMWLARFGEIRELSRAPRKFPLTTAHAGTETCETELGAVRYHLGSGDRLLLTTRSAVEKMGSRKLRRFLSGNASPQMLVRATGRRTQPSAVIDVPGLSPVPTMEPASIPTAPKPEHTLTAPRPRREGISPIWPALLIAILSVALAFWLKKPAISSKELSDIFSWALTPAADVVSSPTPSPTPSATPGGTTTPVSKAVAPILTPSVEVQRVAASPGGDPLTPTPLRVSRLPLTASTPRPSSPCPVH